MSLFDQLGKQPVQEQPQSNPQQAQRAFQNDLASLKANPVEYAKAHGKNLPEGMTDPSQMVQYLLKSSQVSNPYYQLVMRLIGRA